MLPRNHPDRIQIAFDDPRLVANAGLLLPVTLAQHLGLREVVDSHVDLGDAPGRANPGDKLLTLVASALAGGDFIDDADVLRTGGTAGAIGCVVKASSTLGTFLRSFRWGHVRQLDRVSRELLSRAWAAGAGPGEGPLTIDLDSTMCETYRLAKEGARHHGYTGQRGYHPLLAIAAGTGEVLMSRLREGRANTVRGAAHFLRETVGRVRHAGARGQLTVRADSGFYAHALVVVCREMDVRFSITIRQHARLRELIEASDDSCGRRIITGSYLSDSVSGPVTVMVLNISHRGGGWPRRSSAPTLKPAPALGTGTGGPASTTAHTVRPWPWCWLRMQSRTAFPPIPDKLSTIGEPVSHRLRRSVSTYYQGDGKSWLAAHLLRRCLTPGDDLHVPGSEYLLCAASIEQARLCYRFIRAELEPTGGYSFIDSATRIGIMHRRSNTRLRVLSSNGKTAMGIVNCPLLVADEPGSSPFFQGCHRGARQLQGVRNLLLGEPPGSPRLLETLPQNPRDDGVDNTLMH